MKEIEDGIKDRASDLRDSIQNLNRTTSPPTVTDDLTERTPLLGHQLIPEGDPTDLELSQAKSVAGGTVLGIHNLAIVFPQFIVCLIDPHTDPA